MILPHIRRFLTIRHVSGAFQSLVTGSLGNDHGFKLVFEPIYKKLILTTQI